MKYLKIIAVTFFMVFSIACQTQSKEIENITVTDLKTLLSNGDNIQLVDVRTPKEWEEGIIAFGNGGDRVAGKVPSVEEDVCKGWGIDLVWGLGDKVQSSSWLLEKYNNLAV